MLVSFALSTTAISITIPSSGFACDGTATGFPLPFFYSINHIHGIPPMTHSTGICPSIAPNVSVNAVNASLDYLFWFVISVPIVLVLAWLFSRRTPSEVKGVQAQTSIQ